MSRGVREGFWDWAHPLDQEGVRGGCKNVSYHPLIWKQDYNHPSELHKFSSWTKCQWQPTCYLLPQPGWDKSMRTFWRTGTCLAISCPVKEWLIGVRANPAPATPLRKLIVLKVMFDHSPEEYCILWRVCQYCCYHISLLAALSPRSPYVWNGNAPDPKTSWSHWHCIWLPPWSEIGTNKFNSEHLYV